MKQFYDLRLGYLVERPGQESPLTEIEFKAGDGEEVIVQFGRSPDDSSALSVVEAPVWTVESLAAGYTITIGLKENGDYSDGTILASNSSSTYDGTAETYTFELDFNTTEINAALNRGDNHENNDIASLLLAGYEITFKNGSAAKPRSSVKQVTATIHHDIIYGDEGTPTNAGDPDEYALIVDTTKYLKDVIGPTGDGATKLDGVLTASLSAGFSVSFMDDSAAGIHRVYELAAATTAESAPDVIRPGDYAATTNEKVWLLRNAGGGGVSLPVADSGALVSDGTKLVGLDAGSVTAGQTRRIQSPDGDSRVRSVLGYRVVDSTTGIAVGTYSVDHLPAGCVCENVFIRIDQTSGNLTAPVVRALFNGDIIGTVTVSNVPADIGSTDTKTGSVASSGNNEGVTNEHIEVEVTDTGQGSAGSAAQGLNVSLVGYWVHE